jgi:hypothetical protein
MSNEADNQSRIMARGAAVGVDLLRNNSGALLDKRGVPVRFGLGNESRKVNEVWKSSDLIGIWPVMVTPEHVGRVLGVFAAVECKPTGWRLTPGDKRGQAQANFGKWVTDRGGFFTFATEPGDLGW